MNFVKNNFGSILKLYINQIGIVIFSLALMFPLESLGGEDGAKPIWSILASVFSIIFYYVLLYYAVWEIGAKDKIRVDSGRYQPTPTRGFLLGMLANVPNLILSIPLLAFTVINVASGACASALAVFNLLTRLHCSMYLGIILGTTGFNNDPTSPVQIVVAVLFVLLPLLSAGVTHLAYSLGAREIKLFGFLSGRNAKR